jgi:hypothetical protein
MIWVKHAYPVQDLLSILQIQDHFAVWVMLRMYCQKLRRFARLCQIMASSELNKSRTWGWYGHCSRGKERSI